MTNTVQQLINDMVHCLDLNQFYNDSVFNERNSLSGYILNVRAEIRFFKNRISLNCMGRPPHPQIKLTIF
ncbi:MAG: hypothetical protein DRQ57_02020 [Gammaproteobacteria bacterium]|nr:MAG: hypothetical protein DRQ57_02020 [Gammaproteobacteria bacterium]